MPGTSTVKTSTKTFNISQISYKNSDDKWVPVDADNPLPITNPDGNPLEILIVDEDSNYIGVATENTVSQLVMAVNNAIDQTVYDLSGAAFSVTTSITDDFIFDSIELNFSTSEAKTITITSVDGTVIWGGAVDKTPSNKGYLSTAKNIYIEFNRGFVANDNITVDVTQLSGAGTMDCILKTRSGTNTLTGSPAVKWIDTSGTERGFKEVNGQPMISSTPHDHEISAGNLSDHTHLFGFGERENVAIPTGNVGIDIWAGVADVIPHPAVAGEQMTLVSTSSEDGVGGTGTREITIDYIDGSGAAQTEPITTNGTTPTNTIATDITFVNHMYTTVRGSSGVTVGNIDLYKVGDASTVYNRVMAGGNKDLTIALRVPIDTTYFIKEWHCSVTGNKPTAIRLRSTDWDNTIYNGSNPIYIFKDTAFLGEGNFDRHFLPAIRVPGGTTIKASAWATQSGVFITASFNGFYETN